MTTAETNLATARAYLKALEEARPQDARQYLSPDIVQIEHPNRLKPNGDRRTAEAMAADGQRGLKILESQTYEIRNALVDGDRVALEVLWTGVLAIPLGELKPVDAMTCFSGIFLDFADGKIVGQRNHDYLAPRFAVCQSVTGVSDPGTPESRSRRSCHRTSLKRPSVARQSFKRVSISAYTVSSSCRRISPA